MHPGIENYFEGFDGAQYIPRPWLKAVFPHDWPWPYVISPWHFLIFLTFVKKCIYEYVRGIMQIEFIFLELLWFFGYILIYLNRVAGNFIFLCKINTGTFNKVVFSSTSCCGNFELSYLLGEKITMNERSQRCRMWFGIIVFFLLHIYDFVMY